MNSKFLSLNKQDAIKALIIATLTVGFKVAIASFSGKALPTLPELKAAAILGLGAAGTYLFKNVFSNSDGKIATETTVVVPEVHM